MKPGKPTVFILLLLLSLPRAGPAMGEAQATPQEVIHKVKEAAAFLSSAGDEGLEEFADRNGRRVWKDTYIFVLKCDEQMIH